MSKQIKLGTILGYFNILISSIVTLVYTPFMLKMMGQSEYGLYSLVSSVIAYLSVLDMGFGNAMIRFVSRSIAKNDDNDSKLNGIFLILYFIIGLIALIIGIVLLCNIELLFSKSLTPNELGTAKVLMVILFSTVAISFPLSVFDSYIMVNERYVYLRIMSIIKSLIVPIIMIPLLLLGFKSIAMCVVVSSVNLMYHIFMLIYCFCKLKMKISFDIKTYDKKLIKEVFAYSFFVFLNIIVDNVFKNTDQIILGSVSGTIAVSVYAIASQISNMNTQFSTIISGMFLPRITKVNEEKNSDDIISNIFIKTSRVQLFVMLLILSGFIIFGKMFINLWAGYEYIDAYYIVLLLIGPAIVPLTQNICISVLQAKNMHQFRSIAYIILAIINVAISIPLAKMYGGIGAALGSAIATIIGQIFLMNYFYKYKAGLDIDRYWKFFFKFSIQIVLITILFYKIFNNFEYSFIILFIGVLIYIFIYLIVVLFNTNYDERKYIKQLLKIK